MVLSVYLSDTWASYILIDIEKLSVADSGYIKYQYNPEKYFNFITLKKLQEQINNKSGKDLFKDNNLIITSENESYYDIPVHLQFHQVQTHIPFNTLYINYLNSRIYHEFNQEELNRYFTYKAYNESIDIDLRIKLDVDVLIKYIKENIGNFINREDFAILTTEIPDKNDRDKYKMAMYSAFTDNMRIAGLWKLNIDDQFLLIPLVAALYSSDIKIKDFFDKEPIHADIKLIKAPEVEEYEFTKDILKKKDMQKSKFKINELNKIDLDANEAMYIKWKSGKSKFDGVLYGSDMGIVVDTRNIN
jgi:hypothetical protein